MLIVSLRMIVLLPLGCRKAFKEVPGAARTARTGRSPWKLTAVTCKIVSSTKFSCSGCFSVTFVVLALHVDHLFRIRVAALWGAGAPEPSLKLSEVTKLGSGRDRARALSGRARHLLGLESLPGVRLLAAPSSRTRRRSQAAWVRGPVVPLTSCTVLGSPFPCPQLQPHE